MVAGKETVSECYQLDLKVRIKEVYLLDLKSPNYTCQSGSVKNQISLWFLKGARMLIKAEYPFV